MPLPGITSKSNNRSLEERTFDTNDEISGATDVLRVKGAFLYGSCDLTDATIEFE